MARPKKETVDYFPHYCTHGKTLYVFEQRYGNDGYAFWFKLLEMLGSTKGHYLDLSEEETFIFFQAKTRINEELCLEMFELLAKLEAIDRELWQEKRVVWCQNFVDGISDVYKNRRVEIPKKPSFYKHKTKKVKVSTSENPQSKVNESKVNIILSNDNMSVGTDPKELHSVDYTNILDYWNKHSKLKSISAIANKRKGNINARFKEYGLQAIYKVIDNTSKSSFMRGNNNRGWIATFDWVFLPNNFVKVLEGNYLDKDTTTKIMDDVQRRVDALRGSAYDG